MSERIKRPGRQEVVRADEGVRPDPDAETPHAATGEATAPNSGALGGNPLQALAGFGVSVKEASEALSNFAVAIGKLPGFKVEQVDMSLNIVIFSRAAGMFT